MTSVFVNLSHVIGSEHEFRWGKKEALDNISDNKVIIEEGSSGLSCGCHEHLTDRPNEVPQVSGVKCVSHHV